MYFNDEPIVVQWIPAAHTDGDSIVFFRKADVIAAGDIFSTTRYPVIDVDRGGSVEGLLNGLNRLLELAVPKHEEEGGTYIVPSHGRISDEFDVLEYRDMVSIVRDRVQAAITKGQTLAQIKSGRLTRDYDDRYGAVDGEVFVESIYRSLTKK